MELELEQMKELVGRVRQEVGKVIIGQDNAVSCALVAILTNHHALIEGVPGIAKTLLVRTLSRVLDCDFGRIQFSERGIVTDAAHGDHGTGLVALLGVLHAGYELRQVSDVTDVVFIQ